MSFKKSKTYENPNDESLNSDLSQDELSDKDITIDISKDDKIQDILNRMSKSKQSNTNDINIEKEKLHKDKNSIHYDDVEFDKLEENDRKALKDLFTGLPDIYKITGTSPEDSQNTINKKCAEKLKMFHPDRHSELVKKYPEEQRSKELKKLDIQFKLLRDADSILRDPSKRKYYDLQKKTTNSKNFVAQKESFDDFIRLQKSKMTEQSEAIAKNDHTMAFLAMDQKHGFDRKKFEDEIGNKLTKEDTDRRYSDLIDGRDQDIVEFAPKNRFENRPYTNEDFNKMFIKHKLKDEKKNGKLGGDKSIIAWEGISAANDVGMEGATDFVSIDNNYEDLYTDKNFNGSSLYSSKLDSDTESIESNSSDFDMGDDIEDEYNLHNFNKEKTMSKYEEMMNKRQMEDLSYDNRKLHDKDSWKSVLDNPFSISASMGTIVGEKDFSRLDGPRQTKSINKDYADVYKSLVYENNDEQLENIKENAHKRKKDDKHKHREGHKSSKSKEKKEKKTKTADSLKPGV
jgi:hypothetical protein